MGTLPIIAQVSDWLKRVHLVQIVTSRQVYDDSSMGWQLCPTWNRTWFSTCNVMMIFCFTGRRNMLGMRVLRGLHSCNLCPDLEKWYTFKFVNFRTNLRALLPLTKQGLLARSPTSWSSPPRRFMNMFRVLSLETSCNVKATPKECLCLEMVLK